MIVLVHLIALTTLSIVVRGDLAVYCTLNANPGDFKRHADFEFYKQCDTDCTCQAHELLCIERYTDDLESIRLESHSYDYAEACMQSSKCLCNIDSDSWATAAQYLNHKFPDPLLVPIEPYSTLLERS